MKSIDTPAARSILAHSVAQDGLTFVGNYTYPKTWGVYEIEPPRSNPTTRRFRVGNHPIRQRELENEFGAAACIALFPAKNFAEELQRLLNNRADGSDLEAASDPASVRSEEQVPGSPDSRPNSASFGQRWAQGFMAVVQALRS